MSSYTIQDIVFIVAASLIMLGVIAIGAGIALLIARASGRAVHTIADQAARLAQKGITDEISGLVGNASSLIEALTQLIRTNAGIGIFLVLFGFVMLVAAFLMVTMF